MIKGTTKGSFDLYQRDGIWYIGTIRRSTGTSDKKEAQRIRDIVAGQIRAGKWQEKEQYSHYTFKMLSDRFVNEHAAQACEGGQRFYRQCIDNHIMPYFRHYDLAEIDQSTIWNFKVHRRKSGNAATTINRDLAVLSKMFNLAVLWNWMRVNPITKGIKEKVPAIRHGRPLTLSDEIALLAECRAGKYLNDDLADIVTIGIYTGMRSGALLALSWRQIDFERNIIRAYNQKVKRHYILPMVDIVRQTLLKRHFKGAAGLIFTTSNGTAYESRNVYHNLQKACEAAGIGKRRVHDLRHTTGTRLGELGLNAYQIAAILDHSELSTTMIYIELDDDAKAKITKNFGNLPASTCTQLTQ